MNEVARESDGDSIHKSKLPQSEYQGLVKDYIAVGRDKQQKNFTLLEGITAGPEGQITIDDAITREFGKRIMLNDVSPATHCRLFDPWTKDLNAVRQNAEDTLKDIATKRIDAEYKENAVDDWNNIDRETMGHYISEAFKKHITNGWLMGHCLATVIQTHPKTKIVWRNADTTFKEGGSVKHRIHILDMYEGAPQRKLNDRGNMEQIRRFKASTQKGGRNLMRAKLYVKAKLDLFREIYRRRAAIKVMTRNELSCVANMAHNVLEKSATDYGLRLVLKRDLDQADPKLWKVPWNFAEWHLKYLTEHPEATPLGGDLLEPYATDVEKIMMEMAEEAERIDAQANLLSSKHNNKEKKQTKSQPQKKTTQATGGASKHDDSPDQECTDPRCLRQCSGKQHKKGELAKCRRNCQLKTKLGIDCGVKPHKYNNGYHLFGTKCSQALAAHRKEKDNSESKETVAAATVARPMVSEAEWAIAEVTSSDGTKIKWNLHPDSGASINAITPEAFNKVRGSTAVRFNGTKRIKVIGTETTADIWDVTVQTEVGEITMPFAIKDAPFAVKGARNGLLGRPYWKYWKFPEPRSSGGANSRFIGRPK